MKTTLLSLKNTCLKFFVVFMMLSSLGSWGQTVVLTENFASYSAGGNTASSGVNGPDINDVYTNATNVANFPTGTKVYQSGGMAKLGTGSSVGSMTSKIIDLSTDGGNVKVTFDVKGWTTIEGDIKVTITGQVGQIVSYTATMTDSPLNTKSVNFTGGITNSTLTIETTSKRAYIDNINVITIPTCNPPTDPTGTIMGSTPNCNSANLVYNDPGGSVGNSFWQTSSTGTSTTDDAAFVYEVNTSGTYYVRNYNDVTMCWSTNAVNKTIIINNPVSITTQPVNASIASGANTSFNVLASNVFSYQWQVDTGSGFSNLVNSEIYSNVTTATLNISNATFAMNGYLYRCLLTANAPCGASNSNPATLTVAAPLPAPVVTPQSPSGTVGINFSTTISATNSPTSYAISSGTLPAGLSLNTTTGLISGTPATAGSFTTAVTASNGTVSAPVNFTFTIAKGSQALTLSPITMGLPGSVSLAAYITNSSGLSSYSYTVANPSIATETGGTLTAVAVGNTTIAVTATGNANYNAGSGTLNVTVTNVSYPSNSFLSITGTGSYTAQSTWSKCGNAGGCTGTTAGSGGWGAYGASSQVPTAGSTAFVQGNITGGTTGITNITILSGGTLTTSNIYPISNSITVKSFGTLIIGSNLNFSNTAATFTVEDNADVLINYYTSNPNTSLWNGIEVFAENSNITYNYGRVVAEIFNPETVITTNPLTGAKFGNLVFQPTIFGGSGSNWTGIFPNGIYNLTKGNLVIDNSSDKNFTFNGGDITIGGNMTINVTSSEDVATRSSAGAASLIVKGNLIKNGVGMFRLNGSGTYLLSVEGNITLNAGMFRIGVSNSGSNLSTVNLKGNLFINSSASINSLNTFTDNVNFNFKANSIQTIDVLNTSTAPNITFNVNAGSYTKLVNQDFALGTNSKFKVLSGGTLDFGFKADNTALSVIRVSGQSQQSFDAQSGSTLKLTSNEGITSGSTYSGNVQIGAISSLRTFSPGANYHYIGKVDQISGNGLPNALTGKVIVELDSEDLIFKASGNKTINTGGTLEIRKGIVEDTSTNSFGDAALNNGNLTMTGGRYRIFKGSVQPDLTGTYSLTAGLVEYAGTSAKNIRAETYQNIEVTGNNVGKSGADINLNNLGTFKVKSGGVFTINTNSIAGAIGTQILTIEDGAIFKTGDAQGFNGAANTSVKNDIEIINLLPNSTVEYSRSNDQLITSILPGYKKLNISGTSGIKTLVSSLINVEEDLNVTSSLLKIETGKTIKVKDKIITTDTDATNGIYIENSGSLIQVTEVNNAVGNQNVGSIKMQRISQPMIVNDYTYWSSPVQNFTLKNVSPTTSATKFFSWDENAQVWQLHNTAIVHPMQAGRGYIIRAPSTYTTAQSTIANFIGIPNNGIVTMSVKGSIPGPDDDVNSPNPSTTADNYYWNLIGNPYPSAIDATKFVTENMSKVAGTLYFWTHNTPLNVATPLGYSPNDYASWNGTGGVGTAALSEINVTDNVPNGYVDAGQSFFIRGISDTPQTVTFNNSMRVDGTAEKNSQFFRSAIENAENTTTTEKHRVWLNLTGAQNAFNQTLVGYITDATNAYDLRFDGESFGGNAVTFYSVLNTKDLVIQGRALPFSNLDTVPLGYKTTLTGNLTISIDHVDGLMEDQDIYLQDNVLNLVHDLKASNYTFAAVPGTFNNRFVLRYLPQEDLSNPTFDDQVSAVRIYKNKTELHVNSPYETIATVSVYDITGRLIFDQKNCNTNRFETNPLINSEQALIVKVTLNNGAVVTKKVL